MPDKIDTSPEAVERLAKSLAFVANRTGITAEKCEQVTDQTAATLRALVAERNALKAELSSGSFYQEKDIDVLMARAEAAEAKMAGRVKVKPLDENDRADIIEAAYTTMRKHMRGARGQIITEWDGIESWVIVETERRILAALEGQDD